MERLRYLTVKKLFDTAFLCGKRYRVYIYLNSDTGSTKTVNSVGIRNAEKVKVNLIKGQMTPAKHREALLVNRKNVCLIIHDDIGRLKRKVIEEYFNNFMDVIDGNVSYSQYEQVINEEVDASLIITSTLDQYRIFAGKMRPGGLLDRLLVVPLTLSEETKMLWRKTILEFDERNINLPVEIRKEHEPHVALVNELEPRLYKNVLNMSRFLTEDETIELIEIVNNPNPIYSI